MHIEKSRRASGKFSVWVCFDSVCGIVSLLELSSVCGFIPPLLLPPPHHKHPSFIPSTQFIPLFLALDFSPELTVQPSDDLWIINSSNDDPTVWLSSPELVWQIWKNTRLISITKVFRKVKQLIAITVFADRAWLRQFMFKLNSLPWQFLLWGQVA